MTFRHLFSSGLFWTGQVLCGKFCDCAFEEVSSNAWLGQGWCALSDKTQNKMLISNSYVATLCYFCPKIKETEIQIIDLFFFTWVIDPLNARVSPTFAGLPLLSCMAETAVPGVYKKEGQKSSVLNLAFVSYARMNISKLFMETDVFGIRVSLFPFFTFCNSVPT